MKSIILILGFFLSNACLLYTQNYLFPSKAAQKYIKVDEDSARAISPNYFVKNSDKLILESEYLQGNQYCEVIFDNWTNFYIYCYVNGYFSGIVSPWGKLSVSVETGIITAYGVNLLMQESIPCCNLFSQYCEKGELVVIFR